MFWNARGRDRRELQEVTENHDRDPTERLVRSKDFLKPVVNLRQEQRSDQTDLINQLNHKNDRPFAPFPPILPDHHGYNPDFLRFLNSKS